ncbi:type II toxin-antitoxin system RelE/ParE family toxin [Methylobacter svalbardensis]|uniref:type II toxin-antitoxin system RelE/ParE family toxin n=1 Tax=Methylobacter svalbardensis TaxID=3080016 RepID=UPI003BB7A9C7
MSNGQHARPAVRVRQFITASFALAFLQSPPGNRFEALKGARAGQYSIRINDQWRVCFRWADGDAFDVEIVDYH